RRKDRASGNYIEQMYRQLSDEVIDQFIRIDSSLQHPDKFTDFLQTFKTRKAKARRAPYIRRSLQAVAIAAILFIAFAAAKPVLPKVASGFTNSSSYIGEKWGDLTSAVSGLWQTTSAKDPESVEELRNVRITEATVNIR